MPGPTLAYVPQISDTSRARSGQTGPATAEMAPSHIHASKLQSLLFREMLGSMMPHGNKSTMDSGLAGDTWRSKLAEYLADTISSKIDIGLTNHSHAGAEKIL